LAHLIGWDFTNLEAAKAVLAGQLSAFYAHHDKDWRTYNAELVKRYNREAFAGLLTAAGESHHQLIDFLKTIPDEAFNKDFGVRFRGYKVTIARLLQAEMEDEIVHQQQLEAFKNTSQSLPGLYGSVTAKVMRGFEGHMLIVRPPVVEAA
jgi:hypothetical protein